MLLAKDAAHEVINNKQEIRRPENLEEINDVTDAEATADLENDAESKN